MTDDQSYVNGAVCPVVHACGGCPLLAVTSEQERSAKLNLLKQLSLRLGFDGAEPLLVASPLRVGYRNRIRLRVDECGTIAFFNAEKSPHCVVLVPALRNYVRHLREWSLRHPRALAPFSYLEARTRDRDDDYGLLLTAKPEGVIDRRVLEQLASSYEHQRIATNRDAVVPTQTFDIDEKTYQRVPLDGFLQVNLEVNRKLSQHVVSGARAREARTFADLYCGSGNFALPLGRAGLTGVGVECVGSSIAGAEQAAFEQGLLDVRFEHGDCIAIVRQALEAGGGFDLLLVDPPRAGIRVGLDAIAEFARHCIVYCSCNPGTLERDVLLLQKAHFRVEELIGFDMFPGTRHLEVVAWLSR